MSGKDPELKETDLVMVRVKAALDGEECAQLYSWLERWRNSMTRCSRTGGAWEERFDITLPSSALSELPGGFINSIASPLPD